MPFYSIFLQFSRQNGLIVPILGTLKGRPVQRADHQLAVKMSNGVQGLVVGGSGHCARDRQHRQKCRYRARMAHALLAPMPADKDLT